jgi:hypothetical protein
MLAPPDIGIAIRVMTAMIFISAAAGKMRHWLAFQGVVANYRLLPDFLIRPVAYALPPLEVAIGSSLLTTWASPWLSPWAELAAASMLSVFAIAMGVNLLRGRPHIDCGCFQSTLKQTLRWPLVARNGVMVLLLLGIAVTRDQTGGADSWSVLNGLLGAVGLFMVWQCLNTLWSIVPSFRLSRAPLHAHSEEST